MQVPFSDMSLVTITNTAPEVVPSVVNGVLQPPSAGFDQLASRALLPLRIRATAPVTFRLFAAGRSECRPWSDEGTPPRPLGQALWVATNVMLFDERESGMAGFTPYFVYRFPSVTLAERLRSALLAEYPTTLVPKSAEGHHVATGGDAGVLRVEPVDRATQFQRWWDGLSATEMEISEQAVRSIGVTLQAGEEMEVAFALLKVDRRRLSPDVDPPLALADRITYRLNVGFVARRLAELGLLDQAVANQLAGAAGGASPAPAMTQLVAFGLPDGGLLRPAGGVAPVIIWGGSKNSVIVNPDLSGFGRRPTPNDLEVPANLFSFTVAEGFQIASPVLADVGVYVRALNPGVSLAAIRTALQGGGPEATTLRAFGVIDSRPRVSFEAELNKVDPDVTTVLAPEFRDYFQAPFGPRKDFHDALARYVVYEEPGPPYVDLDFPLAPTTALHHLILPNSQLFVRPFHLPFETKRISQLRRSFPVRVQLRFGTAPDADRIVLTQDETDVVRQEYMLHMNWAKVEGEFYYQPAQAGRSDLPANGDVIVKATDGTPLRPKMGQIGIPQRGEFRVSQPREFDPVAEGARPVYPITVAPAGWRSVYDDRIIPNYGRYLAAVREHLASPPASTDPILPPIAARFVEFIRTLPGPTAPVPSDPVLRFLSGLANMRAAQARLGIVANDTLQISSFWRPPEHNETVSKTRGSPHQASRGFDVQPSAAGSADTRSALHIMALHAAGEDLLNRDATFSQILLEDNLDEFIVMGFSDEFADMVMLRTVPLPPAKPEPVYTVARPGDPIDVDKYYNQSPEIEESFPFARGVPSRNLCDRFHADYILFALAFGLPAEWPNPTVARLYYYALTIASHVHFTLADRR